MQPQKQQHQQLLRTAGVLLLAGLHFILPAGHFLSVSPPVIIAMVTVQLFSLAFSFTTSPFLHGQTQKAKKVEAMDEVQKVFKETKKSVPSTRASVPVELNAKTATLGFGFLLLLVVTTKVLSAVGLLDFERPVEGLLLAFVLGGMTRSVLKEKPAEGDKRDDDCSCKACPTGENAPVDDDGCPYEGHFWAELTPAPAKSPAEEEEEVVDLSDLYEL